MHASEGKQTTRNLQFSLDILDSVHQSKAVIWTKAKTNRDGSTDRVMGWVQLEGLYACRCLYKEQLYGTAGLKNALSFFIPAVSLANCAAFFSALASAALRRATSFGSSCSTARKAQSVL
jgi:hypothetical protein